jgi:hypothetical protein
VGRDHRQGPVRKMRGLIAGATQSTVGIKVIRTVAMITA